MEKVTKTINSCVRCPHSTIVAGENYVNEVYCHDRIIGKYNARSQSAYDVAIPEWCELPDSISKDAQRMLAMGFNDIISVCDRASAANVSHSIANIKGIVTR